jgi:aminotransferase
MNDRYLARHVVGLKPSGIRKFFDIVATMKDVISLGIGEPDFVTPEPIIQAGIKALYAGETHYTSNSGLVELRKAVTEHIHKTYGVDYDPLTEAIITVGVSEALYLALTAILNPGERSSSPRPALYLPG